MFASRGGMGGRGRGAFSSAMIGGMFPLLFGQGRAASLGGGIGGLAGGALGGGLGFGLSLFGTVIGSKIQEIDDFNKSLTRLNATLSSSGDGFKTTGKDVSELAKRLGVTKQEAINVLNAFAQFDSSGVRKSLANVFGTDAGAVDQIASARTEASLVQTIFEKRQELGLEVTEQLIDQSKIVDNATLEFALVAATLKKKKEIAVEEAKRISIMERMNALVNPFKNPALIFAPENKDRAAKIAAGFEDTFQEDVDNALQSFQDLRRVMDKVALASATDLAEALREVNIEITKLQNPTYQLIEAANAISGAFSESFKGVIRGTMSVQEAFANMFNRIADHFLDMAAKMAANQLLTSILSAFAPAVSGPSAPKLNRVTGNPGPRTAPIIPRATGGYVTRPEVSLIGEAGEDEYVIPASKMASSMQRYSAGARGDAVVAGGGSSYASGGARGSTTVNYSGPILNFNSEEFVPKSAVGQIIATATSRGAKAGEARTLSSLQNSRSRRSNLGL
jgi:SLT domain-containing protein